MCVASLHVSTQPCAHRWYTLLRPCDPAKHLGNCPEKIKLEGWETRSETCPWCDEDETNVQTHRLFGSISAATLASPSSTPVLALIRSNRSGSDSATMSPLSRVSSTASAESDKAQRHRDMNDRLDIYLRSLPHELLPSARKNYPTYPSQSSSSSSEESAPSVTPVPRRTGGRFSQRWRKGIRLSRDVFRM